jgi:hypothetical protein
MHEDIAESGAFRQGEDFIASPCQLLQHAEK